MESERKRWATIAGLYGDEVVDWIRNDGPQGYKLVSGLPDSQIDFERDRDAVRFVRLARVAATCARWSVGDTDKRPRKFTDRLDDKAFWMVAGAAGTAPAENLRWWTWFVSARGVLWAHVQRANLERLDSSVVPSDAVRDFRRISGRRAAG